jgi:hypothetical protein
MAYRGQVIKIPIGALGLTGTRLTDRATYAHLLNADGISYKNNIIQKEGGAAKLNSTSLGSKIIGGIFWNPTPTVSRVVVATDDGRLMKDDLSGSFATFLKTNLATGNSFNNFAIGGQEAAALNRKLFSFNGSDQVQVLSGDSATTSDIATPPADWATNFPTFGLVHLGKLWAGGNANDPHRLYFSTSGDHENFTGAGSGTLSVYPGDGGRLVGAIVFKGFIIAFKNPVGIYIINALDSNSSNWTVSKHTDAIGCLGEGSFTAIDNDVLFLDQMGRMQLLSTVQEAGSIGSRSLSDLNDIRYYIDDNINFKNAPSENRMVYYAEQNEVHIATKKKFTTTNNDVRFVIDIENDSPARFRLSTRDICTTLFIGFINNVQTLFMGDADGFVWMLDQENKNKDGNGYLACLETIDMDFKEADATLSTKNKIGQFIEFIVEPVGNWSLVCDVFWDNRYVDTITFNLGSAGAALDAFVLDADPLGGEESALYVRRRLIGSGRTLRLKISNSTANQDFKIASIFVSVEIADERFA